MEATFIQTNKGKGFKIVVNGMWFYTSRKELFRAIHQKVGCKFRTIQEEGEEPSFISNLNFEEEK